MNEAEYIDLIVKALRKVPAKRLLLIELANKIPIVNGVPDEKVLAEMQPEINLATAEAKMYGAHTMSVVVTLSMLLKGELNVGPGRTD
jgi:hypothetical protein